MLSLCTAEAEEVVFTRENGGGEVNVEEVSVKVVGNEDVQE